MVREDTHLAGEEGTIVEGRAGTRNSPRSDRGGEEGTIVEGREYVEVDINPKSASPSCGNRSTRLDNSWLRGVFQFQHTPGTYGCTNPASHT
jgi:hypothetical protein